MAMPHSRGLAAHAALDHLESFASGSAASVRARIPAASLAAIEHCPALDWISIEHEHWITTATFEHFGADATGFFRDVVVRRLAETPLLRPLMQQARRLFGIDPGTYLRISPRAFGLMFRGFGELAMVERGPHHAVLELSSCHPLVFEYPGYVPSWTGAMAATLDFAMARGTATCELDRAGSSARYTVRW